MRGTIVVGVDGSGPGRAAVDWAIERSTSVAMDVVLVHVIDQRELGTHTAHHLEVRARADALLDDQLTRARTLVPAAVVTGRVVTGAPPTALMHAAVDADLLVIGTHKTGFTYGRAFASRFLPLASRSRCAVAVIPEFIGRSRRGVVVAADTDSESRQAIEFATAEAARSGEGLALIPPADVMSVALVAASTTASLLVLAHPRADTGLAVIHDVLANISSPVVVLGLATEA